MTRTPADHSVTGDRPPEAGGGAPTGEGASGQSAGAGAGAGGSVTVRMPSQLRSLTGGAGEVVVAAGTVREVIAAVEDAHPGVQPRLIDEEGGLRRFVNIFVADEDVRFLDGLDTSVAVGQTVSVIPAVAGG